MSLDAWYRWLLAASALVIVGVILEGEELWREYREKGWKPIWPKIGFALLVIGLACEVFIQTRIESVDAALKRKSDERIAKLGNDTEVLRSANLTLEAVIQPRHLSPEQQKTITARLHPFAGQRVVITSWVSDGEAWLIGQQIGNSLNAAGIEVVDKRGNFIPAMGYRFGIEVGGPSTDLVKAVVSALQDDGNLRFISENDDTGKMVLTGPNIREIPGITAAIFIGTKPLPEMK